MFNKYVILIYSAILVNIPSFCSDWSGPTTRRSSTSYIEKLNNIQNGLIPQQNNINQQNNIQQNNVNRQQIYNNDPYGKEIFRKCLISLEKLKGTIEFNTKRINEYVNAQMAEENFDDFLDRKKKNINLYFECTKVITEINKIKMVMAKQRYYNDKIIKENENKNLSEQKDKIDQEIKNIGANIKKLENSRLKELKKIQDFINTQNNVAHNNKKNKTWCDTWYNQINIEDETQITDCYTKLEDIENLYKLYKSKDKEYNKIIKKNKRIRKN